MFSADEIRKQFPSLNDTDASVYFDSAATTQKPEAVIETIKDYYRKQNANVHRGSHSLTANATSEFEAARETIRDFIGAQSNKEIIWTRGATEAANLIAQTWARTNLRPDDEILVSEMEHHANIVPWQIVAQQTGAKVIKIPVREDCTLDMDALRSLLSERSRIVAVSHMSNVTGTRNPIEEIIRLTHKKGAIAIIDGAQGIVHERVDVSELDADFYFFSGHKLFAPTGIGVLYGKRELLEEMPVWHGGGKMVSKVSFSGTRFSELPGKFEAGTPNIAGSIALAKAVRWFSALPLEEVENHICDLQKYTCDALCEIEDIRVIGYQKNSPLLSFVMDGVHHEDLSTLLDQQGVAVRAGHHCAHPLMDALGLKGTVRISFALYNTQEDVDKLIAAVKKAVDIL